MNYYVILPDFIAEEQGIWVVGIVRFFSLDLTFPPEIVNDTTEVVPFLPIPLDSEIISLPEDEEIQYALYIMILDSK